MSGDTANISSLCEFEWFQWVWHHDKKASFPEDSKELGRYLGPAKSIGPEMCMHVLKPNGRVIQRSTVGPLTTAEMNSEVYKQQMKSFMHSIYAGPLGGAMTDKELNDSGDSEDLYTTPTYAPYADDIRGEEPTMPEADIFTMDAFDKYIEAQLELPLHDAMASATVVRRRHDADGNPIGKSNANPLLDTRIYEVSFPDGSTDEYAAKHYCQKHVLSS
jgi:hypothetical protein